MISNIQISVSQMMVKYIYEIDIFSDFNISTNGNYI
jgi:hypothetical protein